MHNDKSNCGYMLLFRGTNWDKGLSAEELQKVTGQFMAWFERLSQQGKVTSGHPLMDEGRVVSGRDGRTVVDGPFAESKESVGGYFLLQVDTLDEAVAIAKQCPALEYGLKVEVRQVAEECPQMQRAKEELAHAAA